MCIRDRVSTNQKVVQILPINDTTMTHTWTDSYPYNSISIYAFHPMYADLKPVSYTHLVRVGIVRDIAYDYNQPENVIVEVEVDTDLRIPKGSSAELVPELMGGVRMNILLANNPRERYTVGDTIPGTLNNGMMEKVAAMMPAVEKMLPKLDSILTSLNTIMADQSIPATLHSIEKTTANLEVTSRQLKVLMNNDIPQLTGKQMCIRDRYYCPITYSLI